MAKKGQNFGKHFAELKQEVVRVYVQEHLSRNIGSLWVIGDSRVKLRSKIIYCIRVPNTRF